MIELKGNLFSLEIIDFADAICITTNGNVKKNGKAVMGAGCALDAKNKYPNIDLKLGKLIKAHGNIVQIIMNQPKPIISFPTKNNFFETSKISLIEKSISQLISLTNLMGWEKVVVPRPGCSNGGLEWFSQVKPLLEQKFDDRFWIIKK